MANLRQLPWPAVGLYALLWWTLTREGGAALAFGALGVIAALAVRRRLGAAPRAGMRWARLPRFVAQFVWHSFRGGLDVAFRAFSRDMRLAPRLVEVRLSLHDGALPTMLALIVSLLPGTIAVRLEGERLLLHALDARQPVEAEVRYFEREIAALFSAA
jgi:multicomponent Na+:H+ antiporter subunit E